MAEMDTSTELKRLLAQNKLVLGADETLKLLRQKKVQKVLLTANVDPAVRENAERLCKLAGVECQMIVQKSDEVGAICKKPFAISVVAVV